MSSFYSVSLAFLVVLTVGVGATEHQLSKGRTGAVLKNPDALLLVDQPKLRAFKLNYLLVYALVMSADWFQGAYLFSLYHDEFNLDIKTIAILFVLGFLAAAVSAPFVGQWADQYGRKRLCLLFTFAYFLSCVTKMFSSLSGLAVGRLLGGLATSILFSVFESWLVSASKSQDMPSEELGQLLGRCTLVNGIVASLTGVASDALVGYSKTFKSPFVASGLLLLLAGLVIRSTWAENYGGETGREVVGSGEGRSTIWRSLEVIRSNPSLIVLVVAMTCFETSLYIFVFLWVPTMQDAAAASDGPLPLGTIFSNFMVAFSLGSITYNGLLARNAHSLTSPVSSPTSTRTALSNDPRLSPSSSTSSTLFSTSSELQAIDDEIAQLEKLGGKARDPSRVVAVVEIDLPFSPYMTPSILFHGKLCSVVMLIAAVALAASVASTTSQHRFYSFLLFELAVGLYYPILGTLRSAMVPEEVRATISSLFRVPMNLLVTLALVSGMEGRRTLIFTICCLSLVAGSLAVSLVIVKRAGGTFRLR